MGGEAEGLITYMRTDGVQIVPEAVAAVRRLVTQALRRPLRALLAARIRGEGQERAGSARGHQADRLHQGAGQGRPLSRRRCRQALQAHLAADAGQPGLERRDRAHHRRHRRHRHGRQALRREGHRLGHPLRRLPQDLRGRARRRGRRGRRTAGAGQGRRARSPQASRRSSISPSRRRATARPRSSRRWRSSASAGLRPMPARSTCCATANMSASTRSGSIPRTRDAWSPPFSRASSAATSNTTSPPISRRSSTSSPPASSNGRTCCATSGASSSAR